MFSIQLSVKFDRQITCTGDRFREITCTGLTCTGDRFREITCTGINTDPADVAPRLAIDSEKLYQTFMQLRKMSGCKNIGVKDLFASGQVMRTTLLTATTDPCSPRRESLATLRNKERF